jgi:hypothetical protein
MRTYPIVYVAIVDGKTEKGVAQVPVPDGRTRPSWKDCAAAIPGFFTGKPMGEDVKTV